MKKILAIVTVLMAVFTMFGADDWTKYQSLKTAEDFVDYGTNQDGYKLRAILCLVYADALNNPENYNSFQDYQNAYILKVQEQEFPMSYKILACLYNESLKSPMTNLKKYNKEAFDYLIEEGDNSRHLMFFYGNDKFCEDNNISNEDRFNALSNLMLKNKYTASEAMRNAVVMNDLAENLDEDIVVKTFKKLYRKFYPKLTGAENDPNLTKVNYIANILKAYGYDVNK